MGVQSTASVLLQPRTVSLSFASNPASLQLTVNGVTSTTPFARTVIEGSTNSVSAPSPQTGHQFVSWSDGGAQTHNVTAGSVSSYTGDLYYAAASQPCSWAELRRGERESGRRSLWKLQQRHALRRNLDRRKIRECAGVRWGQ